MYDVTITNNYIYAFSVLGGNQVFVPGQTYQLTGWGSHIIEVPGMGGINFIDLGERKLPGYTNPNLPWTEKTWGGLIRYRGLDAYFRYEGGGQVKAVLDEVGSLSLHFDQGGMLIMLEDMVVI